MNDHVGFAKGKKNVVVIRQKGYEEKEYTLKEVNLHYNALVAAQGTPKENPDRLELMGIALNMLLTYGVPDDEVEEETEEFAEQDA